MHLEQPHLSIEVRCLSNYIYVHMNAWMLVLLLDLSVRALRIFFKFSIYDAPDPTIRNLKGLCNFKAHLKPIYACGVWI